METGLENVPEIIECRGNCSRSWPNIAGAKLTGTFVDHLYSYSGIKYRYTFENLWKKKVTFCLELNGEEFAYLQSFKITPKYGSRLSKLHGRNE
jgi:hypothetical protein